MIWDTHAHLDDKRFDGEVDEVIKRAGEEGIKRITNIGYDLPSSERSVQLAKTHEQIYAAVGVHPHDANTVTNEIYDRLLILAKEEKVIGWGEIGLDYYRDLSPRHVQKQVFIQQIELANQCKLPVIIHNRDAHEDILKIVKDHPPEYGGVFHCFSGSWEMAKILLKANFYISFAGPVTYKNARHAVEVAKEIPENRFLVETDCPYLSPEPRRGQRNEPAYVVEIVKRIAQIKGLTPEKTALLAWENSERLFRL